MKVLMFGIAREIAGAQLIEVDQTVRNVSELKRAMIDLYPELKDLASLKFAVNHAYVADDHAISEDDEIAIIPPVSGG